MPRYQKYIYHDNILVTCIISLSILLYNDHLPHFLHISGYVHLVGIIKHSWTVWNCRAVTIVTKLPDFDYVMWMVHCNKQAVLKHIQFVWRITVWNVKLSSWWHNWYWFRYCFAVILQNKLTIANSKFTVSKEIKRNYHKTLSHNAKTWYLTIQQVTMNLKSA